VIFTAVGHKTNNGGYRAFVGVVTDKIVEDLASVIGKIKANLGPATLGDNTNSDNNSLYLSQSPGASVIAVVPNKMLIRIPCNYGNFQFLQ
jgi:hypothetical protein